ncbi:MAG: T9SS type A sorting domain-containing protein [Candidatus Eisenbacteria bacterium]|nr:T9SS type A sorting domain-containing protein [Candidatus Eisenbacteria bacterium]
MKLRLTALLLGICAASGMSARPAAADTSIFDIQLGVVTPGSFVQCDNVVVTGVGKFGYFIQEPTPDPTYQRQWSGVWVFTNTNHTVHKGDLVNVSGTIEEFFDFTELNMTVGGGSTEVIGSATIPTPVNLRISDINDTGALAEAYEGVLVRVDVADPSLFSRQADAFNEWYLSTTATIGTGDSLLVDNYSAKPGDDFEYDIPTAGTQFSFAQGVLTYSFGKYKLAPRDCENDLGAPCKPTLKGAYATATNKVRVQFGVGVQEASSEDANNYELASGFLVLSAQRDDANHKMVTLTTEPLPNGAPDQVIVNNVQSEGGLTGNPNQTRNFRSGITPIQQIQFVTNPAVSDVSPLLNEVVTIQGKLTATESNFYYLQDADGGTWDGIYSRVARTGDINVGDQVQVTGQVTEFNGATQIAYLAGHDNFTNAGFGGNPVVQTVTAAQIKYRSTNKVAEPYEYSLVKIANATVDSLAGTPGPVFREWLLKQLPDTAGCDLNGISNVSYDPCIGDRVDMTGILRYSFSQYRIAPRTSRGNDILLLFDSPNCSPTAVDPSLDGEWLLSQNRPNPFTGSTQIVLRLPSAAPVTLEVIDVGGRVVRRLTDATLTAGSHLINWDGTREDGTRVAAGTYFYRLQSNGKELSRKLMVLR